MSVMKPCRIPAPAPCASTYSQRAPAGTCSRPGSSSCSDGMVSVSNSIRVASLVCVQRLERAEQIRHGGQNGPNGILTQPLHATQRGSYGEAPDVETAIDFRPA